MENMRMSELKSFTRDRGLRNYSQMGKTELVALLQNNGTPEDPRAAAPHTRSHPPPPQKRTRPWRGPGLLPQHTRLLNLMITSLAGFTAFLMETKK